MWSLPVQVLELLATECDANVWNTIRSFLTTCLNAFSNVNRDLTRLLTARLFMDHLQESQNATDAKQMAMVSGIQAATSEMSEDIECVLTALGGTIPNNGSIKHLINVMAHKSLILLKQIMQCLKEIETAVNEVYSYSRFGMYNLFLLIPF